MGRPADEAPQDECESVDSVRSSRNIHNVYEFEMPKVKSDHVDEIVFEEEGFASVVKRKVKRVARNITIEPVVFFLSFVGNMDYVCLGQLLIDKSCDKDFDFANDTCDPGVLLDGNHTKENTAVQNEIAQFKVYQRKMDKQRNNAKERTKFIPQINAFL